MSFDIGNRFESILVFCRRNSEIEFLTFQDGEITPVEVKSGLMVKAQSLKPYLLKYEPQKSIIISAKEWQMKDHGLQYFPLYYSGMVKTLLSLKSPAPMIIEIIDN